MRIFQAKHKITQNLGRFFRVEKIPHYNAIFYRAKLSFMIIFVSGFQIVFQTAKIVPKSLQGGFKMIFDAERLINRLKDAPNGSEVKIFLYIALNQPSEGIHGFKTTKQQLAYDLKVKIPTIFRSLRWLKDEMFVQELKLVDCSDFMVNPSFVMNNCDREARIKEWNRRCNLDSAREIRLKREKRRRELRNAKN